MGARLWGYVLTELAHGTNRRYTVEWGPASLGTDAWSAIALTLIAATLLGRDVVRVQERAESRAHARASSGR